METNIQSVIAKVERTDFDQVLINTIARAQSLHEKVTMGVCAKCGKEGTRGMYCDECTAVMDREERGKEVCKHLEKIGVGARYSGCSFDNFQGGKQYVSFCRKWIEAKSESLYLWGGYGSGKTHLAVAICGELIKGEKMPHIVFTSAIGMLVRIRATFDKGSQDRADELLKQYTTCPYLVIDDLGAERATPWVTEVLTHIIDRRDRDLRPMVITSNLSLDELRDKLDGRIASRLSNGRVVNVSMPDYRLKRERRGEA